MNPAAAGVSGRAATRTLLSPGPGATGAVYRAGRVRSPNIKAALATLRLAADWLLGGMLAQLKHTAWPWQRLGRRLLALGLGRAVLLGRS